MRKITTTLRLVLLSLLLCFGLPTVFFASESSEDTNNRVAYNEQTGYEIYIDDWAELLTPSEEDALRKTMEPITTYGNVAFISIDYNPTTSVENYAKRYGSQQFGSESYTLFMIDMDYRKICVYSDGAIYDIVNEDYAETITDNVYRYASDEDYFECATQAFEQINTLLEGNNIAQPMKYISNALLAIVIALLINYIFVMFVSRSRKATDSQLLNGIYAKAEVKNTSIDFLHQTRRYSPQSSSSGGGGGGSHGGGGGGGGGSHSF